MHINTTPLYRRARMRVPRHIIAIVVLISMLVPLNAIGTDPQAPYEQEFVITAYYSPLPGQCCYVKGGYVADKILNGEGHTSADGTSVYPGMLAAPSGYAFGTRVALPGIGILTVHDRGGAIQVLENGKHRLDIWAGYGEEGLARALAFGVQRVKGMVYPVGSGRPDEQFALEDLPAPIHEVQPFLLAGTNVLAVRPKAGDRTFSVRMLQERLRDAGYFQHAITGLYGEVTQEALAAFNRDFGLNEPADQLTERTAAHLLAAAHRAAADSPIAGFVDRESSFAVNAEAQRTLRFLGYYTGRTDGEYDDDLFASILRFQQDHWLVGDVQSPGAGRIGPITKRSLLAQWNKKLVEQKAQRYLTLRRVDSHLTQKGKLLSSFLQEGNYGPQVRLLQGLLADRGFFPAQKINGSFGPLTKKSVLDYQLVTGIIESARDTGAGTVGPATLAKLRKEEKMKLYHLVRAEGWRVL